MRPPSFLALCVFAPGLYLLAPVSAVETAPAALINQAGNTDDETVRLAALKSLATAEAASAELRADATSLADFVGRWNGGGLKFYNFEIRGSKDQKAIANHDFFHLSPGSPLAPIAALYRGRMIAWTLIESSTIRTHAQLGPWYKDEAERNFQTTKAAFPENQVARMYLGERIPWPRTYLADPGTPVGPSWAVLQREQLDRLREIILWWINHRQRENGEFGGGWGDDCEMWRWWAPVLLGFDDPQIRDAQLKFSKAALARSSLKAHRFNTEISDVEHAAEDTTDNLVPLLVLEPHEKRWTDWGQHLGDLMEKAWLGRNEQGQMQFKSFYFSATETSPAPARAFDVIPDVGALHPALLVWQRTGDAKLGAVISSWLDTWVAATARAENGKPAGILPASIRWPDGQAAGAEGHWWEPIKPGGYMHSYYIWPSVITEMTDALVVAYLATNDEKYLAPIRSMAAIRLRHLRNPSKEALAPGSEAWCAEQLAPRRNANSNVGGLVKTCARLKSLTGTQEFDDLLALEGSEFVIATDSAAGWQALEAALRESGEALRVNFAGFTGEVRSTDRVMRFTQFLSQDYQFDAYKGVNLPKFELLYRMVTGDKNAPRFPQMAVRWLTPPTDIAALVTQTSTTSFEAQLYSFDPKPRPMAAQLQALAPGSYQVEFRHGGTSQTLDPLTVERGRLPEVKFTLPAQQLTVIKAKKR